MTDEQALVELAKALNHIEEAIKRADSDTVEGKSGRCFDHCTDTVNQILQEIGDHDEIYEHR